MTDTKKEIEIKKAEEYYAMALKYAEDGEKYMSDKYIIKAAAMDLPIAGNHLGDILKSRGEFYNAMHNYEDVAKLGDPKGMYLYGMMCLGDHFETDRQGYFEDTTIKADIDVAFEWIKKSAIGGHPEAKLLWDKILQTNDGVTDE